MSLTDDILAFALTLGFDRAGIAPVGLPEHGAAFTDWLTAGYHGEMAYLAVRAAARLAPATWLSGAASLILLAVNYNPGAPSPAWQNPAQGRIARYAWAYDYHDILKRRLYALDAFIRERTGRAGLGKTCVDSAPLLERDFAAQAGLGFIGRNTCLITPGLGSWTFLAALAVPEDLTPSPSPAARDASSPARKGEFIAPVAEPVEAVRAAFRQAQGPVGGCGRCTRCLDACPTRAFVAPRILDARRCISYLTIELRRPISAELRPLMGNWVFGCDVCQEVCPYNRESRPVPGTSQVPGTSGIISTPLLDLLALDEAAFRARFRGTPVLRAKRRGLVRNACVAAGNWGDPSAVPALIPLLSDPEPLVRGHAAWALGQIGGAQAERALATRGAVEADAWVCEEIASAM